VHPELSTEQRALHDVTRRFLERQMPLTRVRELYDSRDGFEREWWASAARLGWTSLFVPEDRGGGTVSGRAARDAVIVAEETGRALAPGPLVPVSVCALGLSRTSTRCRDQLLASLVDGTAVAAWAVAERGGRWRPGSWSTSITAEGGEIVIHGMKTYVEAAGSADVFLVSASTRNRVSQVLVPADQRGVNVLPGRSTDMTRRFGSVSFDGVRLPASAVVGALCDAADDVDHQMSLAVLLQCAEMTGLASRALDLTLEYGRTRHAFGRPIVSYQALKHRIADMTLWLEGSRAIVDMLADVIDDDSPDRTRITSIAKAYVGDRCLDVVDECIQITGSIGVTWEHDLHLFNRRATVDRAVMGTPEDHRERVFELLAS
jgi:alkylation response protein AidB-like acyl-CoA dehydrogenase